MRALRRRPCQHQRRTLMPQGEPARHSVPRGMRHRRSESDSIHYGARGAKSLKAVVEASTRRARCAPYGKGCASGNVRRSCLKGKPVCHSVPRGMRHRRSESDSIHYGAWGEAPAGECRGRASALCRGARGAQAPKTLAGRAGPENLRGARGRAGPENPRGAAQPPLIARAKTMRAAMCGSPARQEQRVR